MPTAKRAIRLNRNIIFAQLILACALAGVIKTGALFSAEPVANALSPQQELASFHLADPELTIELVAAEPDVISPVAIAFDAEGRLFVAEMIDYPNASTGGRIRLLEDRDTDGHYHRATVFAHDLPFPNGVLPWKEGVLVTAAPTIWYLKDTNGDGRADERRGLFTGFAAGNQQLRANGLTWGLDNWVYGANGRSDGEVRGDSIAAPISLRGHDFRFRPESGKFEAVAGRSQFGLARDDWGNRFLSWNTVPIRHEVLPERYLNRNPHLASTESLQDIIEPADTGRVFPLAPPPLTFNNESVQNFNALAGLTIYRGEGLAAKYRGNAFIGESLLNLVHRRLLEPNGVTFVARRGERDMEFLASSDPWFHPVNFATGPDGALYVVDFYRRFVEHPDFVHGAARNQIPWRTGVEHGRIWRIRDSKFKPRPFRPRLSDATVSELLNQLGNENGWWRDTAQRLLVERQERSAIPELERLAAQSSSPLARLHALYTLSGLHGLKPETLLAALSHPEPRVREHAIRLTEAFLSTNNQDTQLRKAILALAEDPDARVRFQVALSIGAIKGDDVLQALITVARRDCQEHWHALAILSSLGSTGWPLLIGLVQAEPGWLDAPTLEQAGFLDQLGRLIGANQSEPEVRECLALLTHDAPTRPALGRLAVLAGLGEGLARSAEPLNASVRSPPASLKQEIQSLTSLIKIAKQTALSEREPASHRLFAIRVLARVTPELAGEAILDLLVRAGPTEIQSAAASAFVQLDDPDLAKTLFTRWGEYAAGTRRRILAGVPRSAAATAALADAMEQRTVLPVELDASARQSLMKAKAAGLNARFKKLLETGSAPDRTEVVRRFEPALKLDADRERGAAIFIRTCLICHTIQGKGGQVGPDLSGIASRPKEALLSDILDPSRQVSPDFITYTLQTREGKAVTGVILSENASSVTLRRPSEPDETVLRSQIKELRAEGKSLMPDGLEQGMSLQEMADLLAFLQKPDGGLLSGQK